MRKRVKLVSLQFVSWISDSIVNKTRTTDPRSERADWAESMRPCPVEDANVAQTAVDILLVAEVTAGVPVGQQICQGSVGNYRCQDRGWRNRRIGDAEK